MANVPDTEKVPPLSEQLSYSTVRITCTQKDGEVSYGTGFYFQFAFSKKYAPLIITNKHVIKNALWLGFPIHLTDLSGKRQGFQLIRYDQPKIILHPDPDVDLCAISIADIFNGLNKNGLRPF